MAVNTKNIDLVKPGTDEFYDVNIMNGNLDKIDSYTGEIRNKIDNGSIQNTMLQPGCSRIQIPEIPVSPKIEFTGFSYVNLLGKDGNCEDKSKWTFSDCTGSLDSTNKMVGSNGIKVTLTSALCAMYKFKTEITTLSDSKYYMVSAYLKNGNSTDGIALAANTSGGPSTVYVTDTTQWIRKCIKLTPQQIIDLITIYIRASGVSGQYAYVDGIMLNEISATDYALSDTALMAKYPYIDSYACLTNPYFENRRYNLVRNGNGEEGIAYWTPFTAGTTIAVEDNKFKVTAQSTVGMGTKVRLKANTDYYLSGNVTGGTSGGVICIMKPDYSSAIKVGSGTFNSGNNTDVIVYQNNLAIGYCYYDSIMLIEGTTAPSEYKSCDLQRFVVEGQFTQDDKVTIENGKVSGQLWHKHSSPLYGKDYSYEPSTDYTGYKAVAMPILQIPGLKQNVLSGNDITCIKYNGAVLKTQAVSNGTDSICTDSSPYLLLSASDTDTGWVESINPNNDEVKAFMNGWQAIDSLNSRYICFRSMVDGSLPNGAIKTATTQTITSDTVNVTAGTGTNFSASLGNVMVFRDNVGVTILAVSSTTVNSITFSSSFAFHTGDIIVQEDNGTSNIQLLNYCKTNIAPGYEGYRLHYKLTNPEPIADTNVHIEGEIWDLVKGDNYVTIDSGIVLGEVANYAITGGYVYMNEVYPTIYSPFRNKVENSDVIIYKNGLPDIDKWTPETSHGYGNYRFYTTENNFDINATYTVDYQILKTLRAQTFGNLTLSYPQSIIATLEDHSKVLEQKQAKDSALDTLIDLSMYEKVLPTYQHVSWRMEYGNLYLSIVVPYKVPKRTVPNVTIDFFDIIKGGTGVVTSCKSKFIALSLGSTKTEFRVVYYTTDVSTIADIKAYGVNFPIGITVDCRGRV